MNDKNGTTNINKSRGVIAAVVIAVGLALLIFIMIISITQGAASIPVSGVIKAFTSFEHDNSGHLLIRDMRLPRVIGAAFVGCALAVAGALMQGMTGNPLGDTGIMGLNSGAGLAVALCFAYLKGTSYTQIIMASFLGAALGVALVYIISNLVPGRNHPMKLVLAGATVSTLLSALSQGIALSGNVTLNITFWTMGSMAGTSWKQIQFALPVILAAFAGSICISRGVSALSMGEEVALGLGVKTRLVKLLGTVLVVLLAGTSVAIAGTITFIGMMIPHFARFLVGPDYRLIIPVSGVLGAILLTAADLFSKTFIPPAELPVGAVIALLGVPVFLYLAGKQKGGL
ncbi:iron ABC transporter permease [Anaerocolumna sp. AGMB13025]|uniref:FecCD family ABC transporter permease n=1 Tax=Anaerocolumna sp. AGMB13025 TaxID=3039116 RepID=UPI00241E210D|nr:iron ABC transporter permease [Anaerocolumna sp. AGMB13025]WFR57800.1 iron ABC transporter permease [Anaerocolumna sp. AGMB13025]